MLIFYDPLDLSDCVNTRFLHFICTSNAHKLNFVAVSLVEDFLSLLLTSQECGTAGHKLCKRSVYPGTAGKARALGGPLCREGSFCYLAKSRMKGATE